MRSYEVKTMLIFTVLGLLSACAQRHSASVYSSDDLMRPMQVRYGTVSDTAPALVQHERDGSGRWGGSALGAAAAYGASQGSRQSGLASAAGGVAGMIVGPLMEDRVKRVRALEIEVDLDDGSTLRVVQEDDLKILPGDRVKVVRTASGQTRVQPTPDSGERVGERNEWIY